MKTFKPEIPRKYKSVYPRPHRGSIGKAERRGIWPPACGRGRGIWGPSPPPHYHHHHFTCFNLPTNPWTSRPGTRARAGRPGRDRWRPCLPSPPCWQLPCRRPTQWRCRWPPAAGACGRGGGFCIQERNDDKVVVMAFVA